jgi:hypothetical protein
VFVETSSVFFLAVSPEKTGSAEGEIERNLKGLKGRKPPKKKARKTENMDRMTEEIAEKVPKLLTFQGVNAVCGIQEKKNMQTKINKKPSSSSRRV